MFVVQLQDDVSAGTRSATDALEDLKTQLNRDTKALGEMQRAMRQMKAVTVGEVTAPMQELNKQIEAQKGLIAEAQGAYVTLGGEFGRTSKATLATRSRFAELARQAQSMPGPLGIIAVQVNRLTAGLDASRLKTLGLIAAVAGLTFGAARLARGLFGSAIAAQDAARNEQLHFEALTKMRNVMGLAPGNANELVAAVGRVSAGVSISREKVAGYAEQLHRAGLRGGALEDALRGTAIKASALGDAAGSSFAGFVASVGLAGGSVKRLSDDVKARFGGVVQRQMLSLEVQQRKQRENWNNMFSGVNIEPLLDKLKRLRDILDVNTAAGSALQMLMGDLLKPLLSTAETGLTFLRRFFKQMLIGALELKIAYQEVRNWFARAFGKSQVTQAGELLDRIQLGRYAVYILAAAFSALAITITTKAIVALVRFSVAMLTRMVPALWSGVTAAASFAVSLLAVTWPLLLASVAVAALIAGIVLLYEAWDSVDWISLGLAVGDGIVNGIKKGWQAVKNAFSELAKDAQYAFKQVFGIASPSKVFAELGIEIPRGVALGIHQGAPQAQQAAAESITVPQLGAGAGAGDAPPPSTTSTQQNTRSVSIGELHIHAQTSEPKALAMAFRRELEAVLEGVALEAGAPAMGGA